MEPRLHHSGIEAGLSRMVLFLSVQLTGCGAADSSPTELSRPGSVAGPAFEETAEGDVVGSFAWEPLRISDAEDWGHVPESTETPTGVPAGPIRLVERSSSYGLEDAVGRGDAHGVGVAFVDIDNDGWDDLFIINGQNEPSRLFRNVSGHFEDMTTEAGLADLFRDLDGYSIAAADYDIDGDVDVLIGARPTDVLLANDGSGVFEDVTTRTNAGGPRVARPGGASKIVSFGDVNNDGWMDIVSSYASVEQNGEGHLLVNNEGGFEDHSRELGFAPSSSGNPCAVLWSDVDNDGKQDVWVWNDRGDPTGNRVLLRNTGSGFENVTRPAHIVHDVGNPMGIDAADVDRNGFLDYYIADIGNNPLYLNNGDTSFVNVAERAGVLAEFSWGTGFEDFNADGWPDLFVAQEDDREHFLYVHQGTVDPPTFAALRLPHHPVASSAHNVAAAFADFDHDGRVDVVTATTDGSRINLYRNETELGSHRWLEVRIPRSPETGDRGGVTARVVVKTGTLIQFRDITGGSSRASQNALSARFGLGATTGADWVVALWPDGRQLAAKNIEGNQVLELGTRSP